MADTHYLISDASRKVDVESHVLRYWEEELEMNIPRNEMGHRYYTELHIRLFKQIKELKEKGYQLKAIKAALARSLESDGEVVVPNDILEEDVVAALKDHTEHEDEKVKNMDDRALTTMMAEERAEQFRAMLGQMIGQAIGWLMKEMRSGSASWMRRSVCTSGKTRERRRPPHPGSRFFPGALGKRRSLGEMGTSCKIKMIITKKLLSQIKRSSFYVFF